MKSSLIFEVFQERYRLYTKNLTPGRSFFSETLVRENGTEYREWEPKRSKLAAAIMKGCKNVFIRKGSVVLYLGAAHGYTPSFISDIIGNGGMVFALDNAPRVVRDLVFLAQERENIAPLLADANHPESYRERVPQADIIYQDVAQRNQAEILLKNCGLFLKQGGTALIAIKARSIDITKKPKAVFMEARRQLEQRMTIVDFRTLEPFEHDHCFIICKKR